MLLVVVLSLTKQIGRWIKGSPVRVRRGPATVTGDGPRRHRMVQPLKPIGFGKARELGPGARRPVSDQLIKTYTLEERGG